MAMVKVPFNGNLNSNIIASSIYNMIISQLVFADDIKEGFGLADMFRVDGSMYGDTKLFYSTDVLETHDFLNDNEAANLLSLDRPNDPKCQAIVLDTFKQIRITIDNYLSKQAWNDEYSFSQFTSVMLGWIRKTKEVYDNTLINTYVGTKVTSDADVNSVKIVLPQSPESIDDFALRGLKIGEGIADLLLDLKDYSRKYNGWGHLRNYAPEDFVAVWNGAYKNEIRKVDLPVVFHKDGIVDKFEEKILPQKYFGDIISDITSSTYYAAGTTEDPLTITKPIKKATNNYTYEPISGNTIKLHFLAECDAPVYDTTGSKYIWRHFFAGDEVPANTAIRGTFTVYSYDRHGTLSASGTSATIDLKTNTYKLDEKVICKLVHKDAIKFMSGFNVATEFVNPRSLTENHYLTWGYGLDNLIEFPILKVYESVS